MEEIYFLTYNVPYKVPYKATYNVVQVEKEKLKEGLPLLILLKVGTSPGMQLVNERKPLLGDGRTLIRRIWLHQKPLAKALCREKL